MKVLNKYKIVEAHFTLATLAHCLVDMVWAIKRKFARKALPEKSLNDFFCKVFVDAQHVIKTK